MSRFNVGDQVTHPIFGGAVVIAIGEYGDPLVKRDDGTKGGGPDELWIAISDLWELQTSASKEPVVTGPTEAELDGRRLQAIFVNTSAMIQAIDRGEIPEDQVMLALYGATAAYVQILGQRFGSTLDERIAARRASIAEFAA